MSEFLHTVSIFQRNPFVHAGVATLKHVAWQFRKLANAFPHELDVDGVTVVIRNKAIANGCGGLLNAMGYYDPNNMHFLQEVFQRGLYRTFFDIGANIGVYSLIVAHASEARAYAFEPHPFTYTLLAENVRVNELEPRVVTNQLALSDFVGDVPFSDVPGSTVNRVADGEATAVIRVPATTGDRFCREQGVRPDVLKIDVEGHEDSVLRGLADTLAEVRIVVVECRDLQQTAELLVGEHGFVGPLKIDYRNRTLSRRVDNYEDWVFVRPSEVERLRAQGFMVE